MRAFVTLVAILAVVFGAAAYFTWAKPLTGMIKQGLDLQGGVHVVLEAQDDPVLKVTDQAMNAAVQVIRERADRLGVSEPVIQRQGDRRIVVELAGLKDPDDAIKVLGKTAVLEFKDPDGNIIVTGKDLADAQEALIGAGNAVVNFTFNEEGAKKFSEATTRLVGKSISIYLDGEMIQNPVVREPITTGQGQISGYGSLQDARRVAVVLQSGALPVNLKYIENRSVSATLGQDSIERSKQAFAIGIAAVALFMLVIYRGPGLVANIALLVYVYLLLAAFVAINAVMTLPGIAGFVLSIGMAVDANVLIFERIKEELRAGKTLRAGLKAGFNRAFGTIFDSNATTLVAAAILYYLGTGPVRGFAVTLALGSIIHMFTAITLTRFMLNQLVGTTWVKRSFFGVRG